MAEIVLIAAIGIFVIGVVVGIICHGLRWHPPRAAALPAKAGASARNMASGTTRMHEDTFFRMRLPTE